MHYYRWVHVGEPIPGSPWQPWAVEINMDFGILNALHDGVELNDRLEYFQGTGEYGTPVDYPFSVPQVPVASRRLRVLLQDAGRQWVEFFPLRLKYQDGQPGPDGYSVVNYLKVIDCLDRGRSEYVIFTKENLKGWEQKPQILGTFRDIRRLIIDQSKLAECPIFRLWGRPTIIIVREDLKEQIESNSMSGCRFTELEAQS